MLGDSITEMLIENKKTNGLTLDESSNILLTNVDKLNVSSNEATSSLDPAATIEQITSNIRPQYRKYLKNGKFLTKCNNISNTWWKLANQTNV